MLSTSRASSDIRLGSHGGSHTILHLDLARRPARSTTAFSTMIGSSCAAGQFGVVSVMSIVDRRGRRRYRSCRSGRARRCRPGFPDRRRSSARRRCRRSAASSSSCGSAGEPADARRSPAACPRRGVSLVSCRRSCEELLRLDQRLRQGCRPRPGCCRARTRPGRWRSRRSAPAAASRNGCRRAPRRPERSMMVATSCGCAPFISNETIGPLSWRVPMMRSELISRSRSCA